MKKEYTDLTFTNLTYTDLTYTDLTYTDLIYNYDTHLTRSLNDPGRLFIQRESSRTIHSILQSLIDSPTSVIIFSKEYIYITWYDNSLGYNTARQPSHQRLNLILISG